MKQILLTPYPGYVILVRTFADLQREHKRLTGKEYPNPSSSINGTSIKILRRGYAPCYIVYGKRASTLAHEFGHVLLQLFHYLGIIPHEGNGEPFCYMMSHLMEEASDA